MRGDVESDSKAVADMVRAGEAVLRFAKAGKVAFLGDELLQRGIEREFEIFGEAARRLSEAFRLAHPSVPWRTIIGFRNYLIHGYDSVIPEKVWLVVTGSLRETLPELRRLADNAPGGLA